MNAPERDERGRFLPGRRTGWPRADVKPCGTLAAYRRHLRRGERACESCLQAGRRDWEDRGKAALEARRAASRTPSAEAVTGTAA